MSDEGEKFGLVGPIIGYVWLNIAIAQTIIGFVTSTDCNANEELPIFIGVHGLLNIIYGAGLILLGVGGYKQFEFRLVFYLAWIAEGPLCITGIAFYSKTVGYLKGGKTCSRDLITGSVVIESLILFLYILVTLYAIGYEIKTKCKYCKLGDGSGERGHDTEPRAGSPIRQRETRRTEPITGNRRLDIPRRITDRNSEDQRTGPNIVYIHNMNIPGGSPIPIDS